MVTADVNLADIRTLLKALAGRLNRAEAALARVNCEINRCLAEARSCAALLCELQESGAAQAEYASFAERRRAAIKAAITALGARLERQYTERSSCRDEVERLLRQKISLEAAADAIEADRRRKRAMAH